MTFFYAINPLSGDKVSGVADMVATLGKPVAADQWQSTAKVDPMKSVIEIEFATLQYSMPQTQTIAEIELEPNIPWAEEHFQERVGGEPVNPPPSHVNWPFAQGSNSGHMPDGKFSHTYPERLWPKERYINKQDAISEDSYLPKDKCADLMDLVRLLHRHPSTRQAFIPIWWPIDGRMAEFQRVPCTIGYHFMQRDETLHCHYFMRSCDALRHLPDDLYMATRLTQWICNKINMWNDIEAQADGLVSTAIEPGMLYMQITSLHIFEGDLPVLAFQRSQRA